MKSLTPHIEIHGPDARVNGILASIVAHALQMVDVKTVGPVGLATQDTHLVWDILAAEPVVITTNEKKSTNGTCTERRARPAWIPPADIDWSTPVGDLARQYQLARSTISKYRLLSGFIPTAKGRPRGSFKIPADADWSLPVRALARLYKCSEDTARQAKARVAKEVGHGV